jgi:hypothetical protein
MADEIILPFETTLLVRDTCLCMHAQRAARALARRYDAVLRPHGLTNGQFSVLMSLNRPGPAGTALARLHVLELDDPPDRAVQLDVHPVLELVGADDLGHGGAV